MRVAIIGAGASGLACALELEKLGVIADIFERDHSVGWAWPSIVFWPSVLFRSNGDILEYLRDTYGIYVKPLMECTNVTMKSPNQRVEIKGKHGYMISRGKGPESLENQMRIALSRTGIFYNRPSDYKELSEKYDWVVVATGSDAVARDLGVWEDIGLVRVIGAVAFGSFNPYSSTIYLNKDYAGSGYARLTPFNSTEAIIGLYDIGHGEFDIVKLLSDFLEKEDLKNLHHYYKILPPPFTTGRVTKFQVGNILLTGRAAGLTERFLGVGCFEALVSGTLAARAIVEGADYEKFMKPLQDHVENVSAFRNVLNKFDNDDFDKLLALLSTPGIKQAIYNTNINFVDGAGWLLKKFNKS